MVRFQVLIPAIAVSLTCLGIAAILAKPDDVSPDNDPATTSATISTPENSATSTSSDSSNKNKKPLDCDRDLIRADIIQALNTPLGYDESRMKLKFSDIPAEAIVVDCNKEKLNTVEISPDKLELSVSGSFTGLCSRTGNSRGADYEDVRDAAFSFTAKLWLKFRVDAGDLSLETNDATAIISTKTTTLKSKPQQQCVNYEGKPNHKQAFKMIPTLQDELAYAYSQLVDDAIRETWVTPCQGIDRQKIFKEYADDILKKDEAFAFAHEYGVNACYPTDKNARGKPFTASFVDKPVMANMVLSCASNGKIEHIGFKKVRLQVTGSAEAKVGFLRWKKLDFDVTVTADFNFNANKAYPAKSTVRMTRNVAILKFELNQPTADVKMKDGWYSQKIYRFIESGLLLRMKPIYPNSGKNQN